MTWWNSEYPFRRAVSLSSPTLVPEGHPVVVDLPYSIYEYEKVRSDYEDLEVLYYGGATPTWTLVGRTVSVVGDKLRIKFPLEAELAADTETSEYYIYYGKPTPGPSARPAASINDYPVAELAAGGNVSYTRPGDYWVNGVSTKRGAIATLEFYGERARIVCEVGMDKGLAEVQVDSDPWEPVDLFAGTTGEVSVFEVELDPGYHEVRLRVTGSRSETSLGDEVKLIKFEYAKQLTVLEQGEEIDDVTWVNG